MDVICERKGEPGNPKGFPGSSLRSNEQKEYRPGA